MCAFIYFGFKCVPSVICYSCQVTSGSLVYDPFVGSGKWLHSECTSAILSERVSLHLLHRVCVCCVCVCPGSLLVAAAHFGGYVLGGDIDRVLIHGRGDDFATEGRVSTSLITCYWQHMCILYGMWMSICVHVLVVDMCMWCVCVCVCVCVCFRTDVQGRHWPKI